MFTTPVAFFSGLSFLTTITGNTPFVFESASTASTVWDNTTALDSSTVIVAYTDVGNSSQGTAQVLDVSGGTITGNTPFIFETGSTSAITTQFIDSSTVIVAYTDVGNSSHGTAQILDISGGTVTGNTAFVFEAASTTEIGLQVISSTKAIVTYRDDGNSSYGTAQILDISSGTITGNTPFVYSSNTSTSSNALVLLDSATAVVSYRNTGSTDAATAQVLDISGGTITGNTPFVYDSNGTGNPQGFKKIDDSTVVVAYRDTGNSNFGTAQILDISGGTITGNTGFVYESATTSVIDLEVMNEFSAIVVYKDGGNSNFATSQMLTIVGDGTITGNTPFVHESAATTVNTVRALTVTKAITVYSDTGNSSFGTAQILDIT